MPDETETINRTIQLYDFITNETQESKTELAFITPKGKIRFIEGLENG